MSIVVGVEVLAADGALMLEEVSVSYVKIGNNPPAEISYVTVLSSTTEGLEINWAYRYIIA